MKKSTLIICTLLLLLSFFIAKRDAFSQTTSSNDLDAISKQISDLTDSLSKSVSATKPLQSQLDNMQKKMASIRSQISGVAADSQVKRKQIDAGYKDLAEKENLISATIRDFYIKSYYDSPLLTFFSFESASEMTQALAYRHAKTQQDKSIITNIALSITDLEKKKVQLEQEEKFLVSSRASLDVQSKKLDEVISGAQNYQKELNGKIAELSAKQQEIISAKSGGFTFSLSDGESADEYLSSAKGFRESAPAGYFAIFAFGGYSHRNGMSQYGAKARAEAGQSVEDILKAYYPSATLKKDFSVMGSINVDGFGSMPFEDQYLQGIYEMPASWSINALKAQAIAARTYAVRRTTNGQSNICSTQSCQVFKNEKKGGNWEVAVNETKGWVLVDGGGNPVSTEYASTHGGFSKTSGWDTTDGAGGSNFIDKAYEKMGGSPWLYKSWWREGTSNSGNTCGSSNPWLSPEEMADLVNAAIALKTSGIDTSRITPITTACWGGNPYSHDELRRLVEGKGGISVATSVSVSQGNGITNNVVINGISLSASDFREVMNVRAPGYVRLPQSQSVFGAPFFNIEKK
jgi:peptidoglycan hydrolase CwlO-like protein